LIQIIEGAGCNIDTMLWAMRKQHHATASDLMMSLAQQAVVLLTAGPGLTYRQLWHGSDAPGLLKNLSGYTE
jgi:hypothetical protein